jgi:cytochrome c-type biogenesis protein CcmH
LHRRLATPALVLTILLIAAALVPAAQAAPPISSVSGKIICQCGCGSVLSECPHQECGWGVPANQFIEEQLAKGKSPAELVQYYVSQYGESILAAPPKAGFNLVAWVTPFLALVIGAAAIYYLARLWAHRHDEEDEVAVAALDAPERIMRRLEDELRDFDA